METSKKKIWKDNFWASIVGLIVYLIVILIMPPVEKNSILDIVIFSVSFLVGSLLYNLIKK